jgi:hypothetical protein
MSLYDCSHVYFYERKNILLLISDYVSKKIYYVFIKLCGINSTSIHDTPLEK